MNFGKYSGQWVPVQAVGMMLRPGVGGGTRERGGVASLVGARKENGVDQGLAIWFGWCVWAKLIGAPTWSGWAGVSPLIFFIRRFERSVF
jgi:hypothetical protein